MSTTTNTCPNCKSKMSCSCQRRKANDGSDCCTRCVASKNAQLARVVRNQHL